MRSLATPGLSALLMAAAPLAMAQTLPVFTPTDPGTPPIDAFASGLYSATCIAESGCTCAPTPLSRDELAVVLGRDAIGPEIKGIWSSPASDAEPTEESADALHARFGGTGACPLTPLEPVDGLWREGQPFNIDVQCGAGTAMFRQVLAGSKRVTARLVWGGVFSGETIQTAFMAADPDPDYTPHAFRDVSPVETVGTVALAEEGGRMTSTGRMRLLTPRLFSVRWDVQGQNVAGACNWTVEHLVTWMGE